MLALASSLRVPFAGHVALATGAPRMLASVRFTENGPPEAGGSARLREAGRFRDCLGLGLGD